MAYRSTPALILLLAFTAPMASAQADPPTPAELEEFDKNGDGKLDADEQRRRRWRERFRGRGGRSRRPRGPRSTKTAVVERFDADKNGWLDRAERDLARVWVRDNNTRRGPRGPMGRGDDAASEEPITPQRLTPEQVERYGKHKLYDRSIIRTFFLDFPEEDWSDELTAFYRTDVEVPATLTVDRRRYPQVGVRYRGNSSFFTVGAEKKRSLNLSMNLVDRRQRLYGYGTLNLLNAHTDASFLHGFLFSRISSDYVPALKANFVKVVINGESWGIYVNVQQYNRDFVRRAFGTRGGQRWKVPPDFGGGGALRYLGDDIAKYKQSYQLKTGRGGDDAWRALVDFCRILNETPIEELATALPKVLDIDEALWAMALDNVLMDGDGYHSRGSDYNVYLDPAGRFHVIAHDNNETFQLVVSGPGGGGRRPPPAGDRDRPRVKRPPPDPTLSGEERRKRFVERLRARAKARGVGSGWSPLEHASNEQRPLVHRLLQVPAWRARYLHHVKTIVDEWLDWERLGPVVMKAHELLDPEIKRDPRRLYSYERFEASVDGGGSGETRGRGAPPIKTFADKRRAFLLGHESLKGPWPTIEGFRVQVRTDRESPCLQVTARVAGESPVTSVRLYHRPGRRGPFTSVPMHDDGEHGDGTADDGVFGAQLGAVAKLYLYVEALDEAGKAAYEPRRAAAAPYRVREN